MSKNEEKLRWAFELFRHGARTPYDGMSYNFYDCFSRKWDGLKELTGVGLRQHFLVGYRNRLKYMEENNLIKDVYDPREVYLISTDTNRTIMSAMSNLQGIYRNYTTPNLTINQIDNAKIKGLNGTYEQKINKKIEELKKSYIEDGISIMPIH